MTSACAKYPSDVGMKVLICPSDPTRLHLPHTMINIQTSTAYLLLTNLPSHSFYSLIHNRSLINKPLQCQNSNPAAASAPAHGHPVTGLPLSHSISLNNPTYHNPSPLHYRRPRTQLYRGTRDTASIRSDRYCIFL